MCWKIRTVRAAVLCHALHWDHSPSLRIITHLFLMWRPCYSLTGMMSFSLANWVNRWQSDFHICCCIDWLTDWAHWLNCKTSPSDHLRDRGLADLAQCLNSVERGVCEPDCCSCFLLFLRSRWRGNILMSGGERLKEEAWCNRRKTRGERCEKGEKARGRKSIMWTKHTIHLGHLPVVCVCVCKGLYKGAEQPTPMYKYPRCCWWSREKGQSDSAHPYHSSSFSLSLPSIHPLFFFFFFFSSSSSSTSIIFHVVTVCLLHGKNTEDLAWQANYDLRLAWDK